MVKSFKKLTVILICVFMLAALSGCRAEAAMSAEDFSELCAEGTPQQVEAVIKAGTDVNAINELGWRTPLMNAAGRNNNPEVLRVLIQAGANVNAKDNYGSTPLMYAALNDNSEVFKALIQAGANVNAKNDDGWTPLMLAAGDNSAEVVSVLIKGGADVNAKFDDGRTALSFAAKENGPEVVSLLLASGAAVSENDVQLALWNERLMNTDVAEELQAARDRKAVSNGEAQSVIKVVVTGDNVNIRSAPSANGKIYGQAHSGSYFLVDPVSVRDKGDNSEWYKILFDIDAFGEIIRQTDKQPAFEYTNPYISARFVEEEPLNDYDEHNLRYFAQGRPVYYQVGQDFSEYGLFSEAWRREVKTLLSLYLEPKAGARTIEVPAGTVVLFDSDHEGRLSHHYDMDDVEWFYVADENKKLIGFVTREQEDAHFDNDF